MAAQLSATLAEREAKPEAKPEDSDVADFDAANQELNKQSQASVASVV